MATIDASSSTRYGTTQGAWNTLMHAIRRLRQAFSVYRQRRRAYRELVKLDAQALQDIGITRGDISAIVDGRFDRDTSRDRQHRSLSFYDAAPRVAWVDRQRPGIQQHSGQSALTR
jgi:uncharacterized protein YjiS (DUF1127 family)